MKFEIKKKLVARSERVKSVEFHPTFPWVLIGLYSGVVSIYDYNTQASLQYIEVASTPIRSAKFIAEKSLFVCASDDKFIRVFNYNTMEKVKEVEAHSDFIRCIAVHNKSNWILTCSDDQTINLWDLDKGFTLVRSYEEHTNFVMKLALNPKDHDMFASASTDKKVKIWSFSSANSCLTIEGHLKGVNTISFCPLNDRPYIATGSDDRFIKIWDYTNKTCIATLEGHEDSVCSVAFHPELPIIISGSEDYYCKFWNLNTFKLEDSKMFGYDTIWDLATKTDQNIVAFGCEEATVVLRMGSDQPLAIFNQQQGKIIYAKQNTLFSINLKTLDAKVKDGEHVQYLPKSLGSTELFPLSLKFSPNGRHFAILSDKEFVISTSGVYRNSCIGSCMDLAFSESGEFAVKDGTAIKYYKNLIEAGSFKPGFAFESLFGGPYLSVKTYDALYIFDFETNTFIRKIDVSPVNVIWSPNKTLIAIICEEVTYILRVNPNKIDEYLENTEEPNEEGCEEAFELLMELTEVIVSGIWFEEVFVYVNDKNKVNYVIDTNIFSITTLSGNYTLLGYHQGSNSLYFMNKTFQLIFYTFPIAFVHYQDKIMKKQYDEAEKVHRLLILDIPINSQGESRESNRIPREVQAI